MEFELTRNGTTQNYRTLHLQRLADPSLPWNPPPFDDNGKKTQLHRPWLPVNPYLTIDSQSVDVTAYNSSAQSERSSQFPISLPMPTNNLKPQLTAADPFQGNYFAPLTPEELVDAPDHVLWALIFVLKQEYLDENGIPQTPLIDPERWITPADLRAEIELRPGPFETNYLSPLTRLKGSKDGALRTELLNTRSDGVGRQFKGQWCWHMFRRVLPDDTTSGNNRKTGTFRQWMSMKSLERGAQDSVFYTARVPYSPFYKKYDDAGLLTQAPMGWTYDPSWTPRMLWQQTRPNARIFLRTNSGVVEASDLKNTFSRRIQATFTGTANYSPEERDMRIADDDIRRNRAIWSKSARRPWRGYR